MKATVYLTWAARLRGDRLVGHPGASGLLDGPVRGKGKPD